MVQDGSAVPPGTCVAANPSAAPSRPLSSTPLVSRCGSGPGRVAAGGDGTAAPPWAGGALTPPRRSAGCLCGGRRPQDAAGGGQVFAEDRHQEAMPGLGVGGRRSRRRGRAGGSGGSVGAQRLPQRIGIGGGQVDRVAGACPAGPSVVRLGGRPGRGGVAWFRRGGPVVGQGDTMVHLRHREPVMGARARRGRREVLRCGGSSRGVREGPSGPGHPGRHPRRCR